MKKQLLFSYFIFSFSISFAQSWLWGRQGSDAVLKPLDNGGLVATDKAGNAYMTGDYFPTIKFGLFALSDLNDNLFLVKYNSAGIPQWATQPINNPHSSCFSNSITTDISGNIYITGWFKDTITFGSYQLVSAPQKAMFLVKYSPSGAVLWARQSTDTCVLGSGTGNSVSTDGLGSVYVTGTFYDTISFGSLVLKTIYDPDGIVFLTKYDSSGNALWTRRSSLLHSSFSGYIISNSVAVTKSGDEYVTGYFVDSVAFGSAVLNSPYNGPYDAFLTKYDSGGNVLWVKQSNLSSGLCMASGNSVTTDLEGNAYITGYFYDSIRLGSFILKNSHLNEVFLAKFDTDGNVVWAEQSSNGGSGISLFSDGQNHIYIVATSKYDSISLGGIKFTSSSAQPCFIAELDSSGKALCGSMLYNGAEGPFLSGAVDSMGEYIYMAGAFFDDTVFCNSDTLVAASGKDPYLSRWQSCTPIVNEGTNKISDSGEYITLFPNPNNGKFSILSMAANGQVSIEVYNILGEKVYSSVMPQIRGGVLVPIDLSGEPNGVYFFRMITVTGNLIGEGKFIIQ